MIARTPNWVSALHPKAIFRIKTEVNGVFLSFDDGPVPGVTDWVLDRLAEHQAKATFFCLGKQVEKHPDLYQRILDEGHRVGNHSYSHPNGWKTKSSEYLKDFQRASSFIDSDLARAPYGRMKPKQLKKLSKDYRVIFWDVLAADYSDKLGPKEVVHRVSSSVRPGSIVVLHDSLKAENNLKGALTEILDFLTKNEYQMLPLPKVEKQ